MAGQFGYIVTPQTAVIASGSIRSGALGLNTVLSGNIASGQVGSPHIAAGTILTVNISSGAVGSGEVASGAIGNTQIASGTVQGLGGTGIPSIASGTFTGFELGSGAIVSGLVASGQIGAFHLASGSIVSGIIASGSFGAFALASGCVRSGAVISGAFQIRGTASTAVPASIQFYLGAGSVGVTDIGSGQIQSGAVGSGGVFGQAGPGPFCIGSGTISTYDVGSGATVRAAQFVAPVYSGTSWTLITEEIISGARAVAISQSGNARVAMAAVSGRMPAIGITVDNVLSGIQVNIYQNGFFQLANAFSGNFSGYLGEPVWVGRSGHLVVLSGSYNSGGYASGDIGQKMGVVVNSGAIIMALNTTVWSGGPLGEATGGVI